MHLTKCCFCPIWRPYHCILGTSKFLTRPDSLPAGYTPEILDTHKALLRAMGHVVNWFHWNNKNSLAEIILRQEISFFFSRFVSTEFSCLTKAISAVV